MNFKKILFTVLLISGVIFSCEKKEDQYQSSAVITGPDIRECICCGGYSIEMNDSTYNFDTLPASSNIELNTETFPINVKLDWSYDKKCGGIQYITISRIAKQ
ncbi:MAG TPA: hypothetical protein VKA38_02620 [Draconibacterium sp.]|nr:hypothetical protein [Draconibacterium sp.]